MNVMHHACLKNIFEKLIVGNGAASLDFKYPTHAGRMSIGIEAFQYFPLSSKEYGNNYLVFVRLSLLYLKPKTF